MHNIRHVLTVLKKNVRIAVMTPTVFLLLNMTCCAEMTTWNLAPIAIDCCAKGVIMILTTAQFAAASIVRLAGLGGTRT